MLPSSLHEWWVACIPRDFLGLTHDSNPCIILHVSLLSIFCFFWYVKLGIDMGYGIGGYRTVGRSAGRHIRGVLFIVCLHCLFISSSHSNVTFLFPCLSWSSKRFFLSGIHTRCGEV